MDLTPGTELTVEIVDIAFGGKGVARIEGAVCFIPFTVPGEKVKVRITAAKKNFLEAELIEIIEASSDRTEPVCEYFGKCGGCQYQHIKYQKQLELKKDQLKQVLKRIGRFEELPEISEIIPSPNQYNYRNRITLNPQKLDDNYIIYGYKDLNNRELVEISACPLAQEEVNDMIKVIRKNPWGKKNIRRDRPKPATLRASGYDEPITYYGNAPSMTWRTEKLGERKFRVPLGSFYQVNPEVAEELFFKVNEWIKDLPVSRVVDAFCGAGFLSIGVENKHIVGIECDKPSIEAAEYNAMQWGIKSFNYLAGNANKLINKYLRKRGLCTLLIMDPPRKGCGDESIKAVREHKPAWILYVSCDPATLAKR